MTPAELRRLAGRKTAAAESLGADAARLRPEAAALRGALEPLVAISARVWIGPAAREFEDETRSRGRLLDQQADRLIRIADELAGQARRLHNEAADLRTGAIAAEADRATEATLGMPSDAT